MEVEIIGIGLDETVVDDINGVSLLAIATNEVAVE